MNPTLPPRRSSDGSSCRWTTKSGCAGVVGVILAVNPAATRVGFAAMELFNCWITLVSLALVPCVVPIVRPRAVVWRHRR